MRNVMTETWWAVMAALPLVRERLGQTVVMAPYKQMREKSVTTEIPTTLIHAQVPADSQSAVIMLGNHWEQTVQMVVETTRNVTMGTTSMEMGAQPPVYLS